MLNVRTTRTYLLAIIAFLLPVISCFQAQADVKPFIASQHAKNSLKRSFSQHKTRADFFKVQKALLRHYKKCGSLRPKKVCQKSEIRKSDGQRPLVQKNKKQGRQCSKKYCTWKSYKKNCTFIGGDLGLTRFPSPSLCAWIDKDEELETKKAELEMKLYQEEARFNKLLYLARSRLVNGSYSDDTDSDSD